MDTRVTAFAVTQDAAPAGATPAVPAKPEPAPAPPPSSSALDLRLVIEEDQGSGSYVYKTVNRRTGEVLQSLPRADILKLREDAAYMAGSVINTDA